MDKWDQEKLEQVVKSKQGNPKTTTDIVCKYFLEAIENQKYGWFWECPNGGKKCMYRHALPPGFVLKTKAQKKAEEEGEDQITIEEFLETERHKLGSNLTPVTLESFTEWKKNRKAKQEAEEELKRSAKEAAFKAGKAQGMSGRDLFTFNPDLVNQLGDYDDDDDIFDLSGYKQEVDEQQEERLEAEQVHNEQSDEVYEVDGGDNVAENPYEEGCSSSTSNNKTENKTTTLVTEEGLEVKEDLFAAEDLDDLDEEDEEE
ncbi:hypothetical protein RclHR1_02570011 [Rhizophagus clarus]|nr:hypothetical protein RclHR1_02570011 [Rhizophagus clarus]